MIYLIPDAAVVITVPSVPSKLLASLSLEVEPEKFWRPAFNGHLAFEGEVGEDSFTIRRFNTMGRKGISKCNARVVANSQGGSDLHLSFFVPKLQYLQLLFLPAAFALGSRRAFSDLDRSPFALLPTFLVALIVAVGGLIQFNIEVQAIQKHLQNI